MKNRKLTLAALIGLLASPVLLQAQGSAVTPGKIGIITLQPAIAASGEGKKAFAEIQKKFQPRQQELQRQQQEIQALQDQVQKQANTLNDEEERRLRRELDEKQKIFNRSREDAEADYRVEGQEVVERIGRKMMPLINDYAQQNGFVMIIDPSAVQLPVYFLAKEIDITEEIVKRFDAANPVKADATSNTSPPAKPAARPPSSASKPATVPKPTAVSKPAEKPKQ